MQGSNLSFCCLSFCLGAVSLPSLPYRVILACRKINSSPIRPRSGLTPLRAQISSDRLVYCKIYPLAGLYLSLSAPIIHLDSAKIKNQLLSVPVGMPAVPDTWVSVVNTGSPVFSFRHSGCTSNV